jgi:hypothetical protein
VTLASNLRRVAGVFRILSDFWQMLAGGADETVRASAVLDVPLKAPPVTIEKLNGRDGSRTRA